MPIEMQVPVVRNTRTVGGTPKSVGIAGRPGFDSCSGYLPNVTPLSLTGFPQSTDYQIKAKIILKKRYMNSIFMFISV